MARSRRRVQVWGRVASMAVVWSAVAVTTVAASGGATLTTGCTAAELVPAVREADANQGLAGYTNAGPLVFGKDTVVRLYMSLPTCAVTGQSIQLAGGSSVSVTAGTTTNTVTTPMPGTSTVSFVPYSQGPSAGSAADPVFLVPGADLAPLGQLTTWNANFTVTVNYTAFTAAGAQGTSSTLTYSFGAAFDKQANALRVLVVPMGNLDAGTAQLTAPAQSAVVDDMTSVISRMLPVGAGVGSLGAVSTTGTLPPGLRYQFWGQLNLGPSGLNLMNSVSPAFCGSPSNFSAVESGLDNVLQAYNNNNPSAMANRVLGVVDQSVTTASQNGTSCYLGMAHVGGQEAWSDIFYGSTAPDYTGAIMGMELDHTLGNSQMTPSGVTPGCGTFVGNSTFHSVNVAADTCSPGRAYNVGTEAYLANSRTVMDLSDSYWTDPNVLLETQDYAFADCVLGGSQTPPGSCSNKAAAGFTPAQQQSLFYIAGSIILGSPDTADVSQSYQSSTTFETGANTNNPQFLLTYLKSDGTTAGPDDGLYVSFGQEAHPDSAPPPSNSRGSFSSARVLPSGTDTIELRDTAAPAPGVLWKIDISQLATAPAVTAAPSAADTGPVVAGPVSDVTQTAISETAPTVGGPMLAWAVPAGIVVAPTSNPGDQALLASSGATSPALSRDGKVLAYEDQNGDIYTANLTWDGVGTDSATFSNQQEVYNSILNSGLAPAHHPTFAPPTTLASSDRLAVEFGGNIYVIYLQQGSGPLGCSLPGQVLTNSCNEITSSGADSEPAWGPADATAPGYDGSAFAPASNNLVALMRSGGIVFVDTTKGESSVKPLVAVGTDPSWDNALLAYAESGNLWVLVPSAPATSSQQLTQLGTDGRPALVYNAGGTLYFRRQYPGQSDIAAVPLSPNVPGGGVTYTATASNGAVSPSTLRAEFVRTCPAGDNDVLAAAVAPNDTDGSQARFQLHFDPASLPTLGCQWGKVQIRVSNGWGQSDPVPVGTTSAVAQAPVVAISSPTGSSSLQSGHPVVLWGSAYDAQNGPLPPADLSWTVNGQTYLGGRVELQLPPGTYQAVLTANDSGLISSQSAAPFTVVANTPPTVSITAPTAGAVYTVGASVMASATAIDAQDGSLPPAGSGYCQGGGCFDWEVTAPDGTTQTFGNSPTIGFTPTTVGSWSLTAFATDSDGAVGQKTETIVVNPVYTATVKFSPSTLNAPPLPSDPNWVTVNVWLAGHDLALVDPASARVVQIGQYTSANDPLFPNLQGGCLASSGCSASNGWQVSGTYGTDQSATVQFDRITLARYLAAKGLVNQYVPVTVAASAPAWSLQGVDPKAPYVSS